MGESGEEHGEHRHAAGGSRTLLSAGAAWVPGQRRRAGGRRRAGERGTQGDLAALPKSGLAAGVRGRGREIYMSDEPGRGVGIGEGEVVGVVAVRVGV